MCEHNKIKRRKEVIISIIYTPFEEEDEEELEATAVSGPGAFACNMPRVFRIPDVL